MDFPDRENVDHSPEQAAQYLRLTPKELKALIVSRKYVDALSTAAQRTAITGHETGFETYIAVDKTLVIKDVREGDGDSMTDSTPIKTIDGEVPEETGFIADHHFHPDPAGHIQPSPEDLTLLSDVRYDGRPPAVLSIGVVRDNGDIDTLLMKPYMGVLHPKRIARYERNFITPETQEEVIQQLEEAGLHTIQISYKKRNGVYRFTQQSDDALQTFGTTSIRLALPTEPEPAI